MTLYCQFCNKVATHIFVTDSNPPILRVCIECGAKQQNISLTLNEMSEITKESSQ